MPRSDHLLAFTGPAAALAMLAVAAGCSSKNTTAPAPAPRAVSVRVTDAGGLPVAHAIVFAVSPEAAQTGFTDTSGTAHFSLEAGTWTVYTSVPGTGGPAQVAGGDGMVPPDGGPDTVLFRLRLADEGVAFGHVLLSGRTDHHGTLVLALQLPIAIETLPDGAWRLDGLPPGSWQGVAAHAGFQPAEFPLVVPAPGDTLTLDAITLPPAPTP